MIQPEIFEGTISATIAAAIQIAARESDTVQFEFNGVTLQVSDASDPVLIYRDWARSTNGYLGDAIVGPQPSVELSAAELASDACIKAASEARREAGLSEMHQRIATNVAALEARLATIAPMQRDEARWLEVRARLAQQHKPYFVDGICTFTERWARLMQHGLAAGQTLDTLWTPTSLEADAAEFNSGGSFAIASYLLCQSWTYPGFHPPTLTVDPPR